MKLSFKVHGKTFDELQARAREIATAFFGHQLDRIDMWVEPAVLSEGSDTPVLYVAECEVNG